MKGFIEPQLIDTRYIYTFISSKYGEICILRSRFNKGKNVRLVWFARIRHVCTVRLTWDRNTLHAGNRNDAY